jgi:AcrR family transcriptional regulator
MPDRTAKPSSRPPRWITHETEEKPVRQPLTRRRVVLAALALAEEEGLGALTMRRAAAALQVTPMSLYNHVADKAELIDLMLDYVIGDVVRASADDTGPWHHRLRMLARRNHQMWREHPGFARVYTEGVTLGPYGLAITERCVGILREAGFGDGDAADALRILWNYSIASVLVAPVKPVDHSERGVRSDGTGQGRIETYFSALPVDEIPNLAAVAGHLAGDSFEFGLELIMSGLQARLEARRSEASPA